MFRFAEPFRAAKKSQPSRSGKRAFMCFVDCSHGWWNWQDRGEKKCLSVCCVCGNLCSSSLDLPCCSGNQGNCSQSSEAGWNHNSPIDTRLHCAEPAGWQGKCVTHTVLTGDPWHPPVVLLSRAAPEIPIRTLPVSSEQIQGSCGWGVARVKSTLAPHLYRTRSRYSESRFSFPSALSALLSDVRKSQALPWRLKHVEVGQRCCVEPYVDPNHQEILWVSCPSFVAFRPSLVLVRLPGTDVWRSHPVCHPVPASFLLKQEPLIFHFELTLGV